MQLKRLFLLGMAGSLTVAALAGVYALTFGQFGEMEWRIIATTLSVGLFCLAALGAAVVLDRGRWRPAMMLTLGLCALGLVVYVGVIWLYEHLERIGYFNDAFIFRTMFVLGVWAVALPYMGLLALAPRTAGLLRWARLLSIVFVGLLAFNLTAVVVWEIAAIRSLGVMAILAALGTISVPILVRVQRIDSMMQTESTPLAVQLTCPRCLCTQRVQAGHSRCTSCRLKFRIEIEEPRCPGCNYLLHMLAEPVCPECGRTLGMDELASGTRPHAPSAVASGAGPAIPEQPRDSP